MKLPSYVGYLELIGASVISGLNYAFFKYLLLFLSPVEISFYRFLFASVFFLPFLFFKRHKRVPKKQLPLILILAFLGVFAYQLLLLFGETGISAGEASFLISMEPLMIGIIAISLSQEKFSLLFLAGVILSTIGIMILNYPISFFTKSFVFVLLVLAAALVWSIYTVLGKRILKSYDSMHVTALIALFGTAMLFPAVKVDSYKILGTLNIFAILVLTFLSFAGTFLNYFLWFNGLSKVRSTTAGMTLYISPFVTILVALFLLSESVRVTLIVGGTLVICGAIIGSFKDLIPSRS